MHWFPTFFEGVEAVGGKETFAGGLAVI